MGGACLCWPERGPRGEPAAPRPAHLPGPGRRHSNFPGMSTVFRRAGVFLYRFPGLRLALLLAPPLVWMVVCYLLSLALLFLTAFWRQDPGTSAMVQASRLRNF